MNLVSGADPVRVYASGSQDVNHLDEEYGGEKPDILDNAFVIVDYDNGIRASLDLCMFAEASRNEQEISVVGTLGKAETALAGDGLVHIGRRHDRSMNAVPAPIDESVKHVGFHFGASFIEVSKFCDAVRSGSAPDVDVRDGLRSVLVGVAAHRSIDEGRPVAISELLPSM
jgi:predicted dehydrogenase